MAVVRDYDFATKSNFGLEAGKQYITELLKNSIDSPEQHSLMKSYLKSYFGEIKCSLLPIPNDKVTNVSCTVSG